MAVAAMRRACGGCTTCIDIPSAPAPHTGGNWHVVVRTPKPGSHITGLVVPVGVAQGALCKGGRQEGCEERALGPIMHRHRRSARGVRVVLQWCGPGFAHSHEQRCWGANCWVLSHNMAHTAGCGARGAWEGARATGRRELDMREQYALRARSPPLRVFVGAAEAVVVRSRPRAKAQKRRLCCWRATRSLMTPRLP